MDYSFLRLLPSFNEAKQMFDPKQSTKRYYDCISLHPDETYLQITNSKVDIVFNGSYKVSIIDCSGEELKDISDRVTIFEFFDIKGVRQIAYEISNIGSSWYGENVFLKFENTVGSEVFFSSAFTVTDENVEETVRIDYKSYGYFQGVNYQTANYFQSIRIRCEFQSTTDETETATYIQTTGNVLSKNPTIVFAENYLIDYINNFTFRALSVALKSDLVYLDLYRVTDKPVPQNGERLGNSNVTSAEIKLYRDLDDKFDVVDQLTPLFQITQLIPSSTLNQTLIEGTKISINFSKDIVLGTGQLKIFNQASELIATLYQSDFISYGNNLESVNTLDTYISEFGNYYITFSEGLVKSVTGDNISITSNTEWTFVFSNGDWSADDWSADDFLIYE